ncbi:hypothetical protein [Arthrobacter monumenti]
MARKPGARSRTSVKAPLIFSAVLAVIAGIAVTIFSTGGSTQAPRVDLGITAAGIVFIVALVVAAMLSMSEKPNDQELGQGSGINLSSSKIPGGAQNANQPRKDDGGRLAGRYGATEQVDAPETGRDAEGSMRRVEPEHHGGVDSDDETPGPLHPPKK